MPKQPIASVLLLLTTLTAQSSLPQPDIANSIDVNTQITPCGTQLYQVVTDTDTTQYTYGRRLRRVKTITNSIGTTAFVYKNSTVTETMPSGATIVYNLDPNGLATNDSRGVTYSYVSGYCTEIDYPAGAVGNDTAFIIKNSINSAGNIYKQERIGWNDYAWYFIYTGYPSYEDDLTFFGRKNTNWPWQMQDSDNTNVVYTYALDDCGRVSTQTVTTTAADGTVTTATNTYTYY